MNNIIENIIKQEPFVGEDGLDYIKVTKEILTPRKTYLKGTINGKYRGDKIPDENEKSDLYDFEIYEAEVNCNSIDDFCKNKPFIFPNDFKNIDAQKKIKGNPFPKSKLPKVLPVIISANNKTFGINVLEPKLYEFSVVRKLHQIEGNEVFGSFNAYITGFVFDYERKEEEEIIGPIIIDEPEPPLINPPSTCHWYETGETETKPNYIRYEYECKLHNHKKWSPWIYINSPYPNHPDSGNCLGELIGLIGIILGLIFFVAIFPSLLYFIGFYILIFLISWLSPYLKWIFRGIGLLFLFFFIGSLINLFVSNSNNYTPKPTVFDDSRERNETIKPIVDNTNTDIKNDYLIKKYREWKDYDGKIYSGYYTLKMSDVKKANFYKNNLNVNMSNINSYDKVVFSLKEYDKIKLNGVYKLFDSIQNKNKLSKVKFAEMIVSFVQDIPYVLILEDNCDANLYNDNFTRKYLLTPNAKCSGYQKFGINTPVEFLANLNGDCDTRTLFLYTMLSYYNYDVALLSSEFYGHSILGINLPLEGKKYFYNNQEYTLWETTLIVKPGLIPNQISNTNNWRISLKSQ